MSESRRGLIGLLAALLPAVAFAQPSGEVAGAKKERKKEEVLRINAKLTAADEREAPHPQIINGKKRAGSYRKVHVHKMAPGKSYVIEMTDPERRSANDPKDLDPFLRLEDSTGKELAFNDDIITGQDRNARIVFTPAKEDEYRIIATSFEAGRTGPYVLTIRPVVVGVVPGMAGGFTPFQISTDFDDISITPMPPWGYNNTNTGNEANTHGYIEYRFVVENNSETDSHTVTLTLPRDHDRYRQGHFLYALRQTVEVKPGATRYVSILQPDLPLGGNNIQVEIDGRLQNQHVQISLFTGRGNRTYSGGGGGSRGEIRPTILVSSDALNQALRTNAHKSAVGGTKRPPSSGGTSYSVTYNEPGPYFNKQYTYYETIRFQSAPLLVEGWSNRWQAYTSWDGVVLDADVWQKAPADAQAALTQYVECGGSLLIVGAVKLPPSWERSREDEPSFIHYFPGFGQCRVAKKVNPKTKQIDVAAWDPDEWRDLFRMWEQPMLAWQQVRSPTEANKEFQVVEGMAIPVRGLFVVMFVFVVLIGPVNVFWLSRSKRRIWLLWTVPLFSLVTCVLVVSYMVATEGWRGHVNAYGITVLDETSQRATTICWEGFYCPTTPSGGLRFSLDTELTPHLNIAPGRSFSVRHPHGIDWGDDQHLSEGWVSAKVPIHFLTRRSETRRERVTIHKNDAGALAAVNGLGADIRTLYVAVADGRIHIATDVHKGVEAKLEPTEQRAGKKLNALSEVFAGVWTRGADEMEKKPAAFLQPGCYLAILDDSPFLEPGLQQTQTHNLRSVVFGILKEVP